MGREDGCDLHHHKPINHKPYHCRRETQRGLKEIIPFALALMTDHAENSVSLQQYSQLINTKKSDRQSR